MAAETSVDWRQRGFVVGRTILDNILDIEAAALAHQILNNNDSGMILMDFGAAFPSLLNCWIFFVLNNMCIDARIINFFTALYADTLAGIFLRGDVWGYINMQRGVRQG
eukprot:11411530-Heterocapsa_arctica.AAC.1